jgi:hypothetical protein
MRLTVLILRIRMLRFQLFSIDSTSSTEHKYKVRISREYQMTYSIQIGALCYKQEYRGFYSR